MPTDRPTRTPAARAAEARYEASGKRPKRQTRVWGAVMAPADIAEMEPHRQPGEGDGPLVKRLALERARALEQG